MANKRALNHTRLTCEKYREPPHRITRDSNILSTCELYRKPLHQLARDSQPMCAQYSNIEHLYFLTNDAVVKIAVFSEKIFSLEDSSVQKHYDAHNHISGA